MYPRVYSVHRISSLQEVTSLPSKRADAIRVLCISDTHCQHQNLDPILAHLVCGADMLIHAGDFTLSGTKGEVKEFASWLASPLLRNLAVKVIIAGNHEKNFDPAYTTKIYRTAYDPSISRIISADPRWTYLEDSACEHFGLVLWGSPRAPRIGSGAFGYFRVGSAARDIWSRCPEGTDVVVSHGPPSRCLDLCAAGHVGCKDLKSMLQNRRPALVVCGHVHENAGVALLQADGSVRELQPSADGVYTIPQTSAKDSIRVTVVVNAAVLTARYKFTGHVFVVDVLLPSGKQTLLTEDRPLYLTPPRGEIEEGCRGADGADARESADNIQEACPVADDCVEQPIIC